MGLCVFAQFKEHVTVRTRLLDQIQDFEQHLMLGILPDDVAGFAHCARLNLKSGFCHDSGQYFAGL
jgi:hypothetical protein